MKVLVAPLDWGLGHATRCVPVVREFLRQGAAVELAVVNANASFFKEVFPDVPQHLAPSYGIVYPKHGYNMALWLVKNSAHLNMVMLREHAFAEQMVKKNGFDVLFSDNRFGFYSSKAYNVYMTHQRRIAFPQALSTFEGVGQMWHSRIMKKFDEVWVPDLETAPGYAGNMSHVEHCPVPVKFVGPLSRFENSVQCKKDVNVVAVVSGVEPARTRFEEKLREALRKTPGKHVMILGKPSAGAKNWKEGNIEYFNHLPTDEFAKMVGRAEWVVSRGGYSTIMDMAVLGAKCICVPTPGQYEQIVLSKNLAQMGYVAKIDEDDLNEKSLNGVFGMDVALPRPEKQNLLSSAVNSLVLK